VLLSEAVALRLGACARLSDITCIFDMYCGAMHCSHVRASEQGCAIRKEDHSWASVMAPSLAGALRRDVARPCRPVVTHPLSAFRRGRWLWISLKQRGRR